MASCGHLMLTQTKVNKHFSCSSLVTTDNLQLNVVNDVIILQSLSTLLVNYKLKETGNLKGL